MNFLKQFLKLGSLVLVVVLLLVGAVSYSIKNKKAENAYAIGSGEAGSTDVTGEAWSENIGFIRFNGVAKNGSPYGVGIKDDGNIGRLSGHAWSGDFSPSTPDIKGNIGWISFNRLETGNPPASASYDPGFSQSGQPLTYLDTDNKLKGWARALAACDSTPCTTSGAGTNSGGWDGWIAVGDAKSDAYSYGATLDIATKQFAGYAWGGGGTGATQTDKNNSSVIGWISFNCSNRGVCSSSTAEGGPSNYNVSTNFELNKAPSVAADSISADYCNGRITFNWTFSDPNISGNLNQQRGYEIKAAYDPNTPSTIISSSSTGSANSTTVLFNDLTAKLGSSWYDKKLKWQITVWDNGVNGSGDQPKSATNTKTESSKLSDREYPVVDFDSNPALDKIYAEQNVQFLDKSICYSSGNTPAVNCSSWSWDIQSAAPSTSTEQNPIVQFAESVQNKAITLIAKDEKGDSCSVSKNINIGLPIPKIEEKK